VFHLDPRARWQDGQAVTAADVAFTYDAYTDSLVNSSFRSSLRHVAAVTPRDSLTVVFRSDGAMPRCSTTPYITCAFCRPPFARGPARAVAQHGVRALAVGDGPYRFVS